MRRSVLLGMVVSMALLLGASAVALAARIDCTALTECIGTNKGDTINGSPGDDDMRGRAGGDLMRGNGGSDEMEGGLGADRVLGNLGNDDSLVWGGEQRGSSQPYTYPDKSGDVASGGRGRDQVYGGFGQGGVDRVFGNQGNDEIVVAQRGFPAELGEVEVTREVVDCGGGDDTVYRDRRLDVIADNCEHKRNGFPDMVTEAAGTSDRGGLIAPEPSQH
jgi:Ca2+-binding RTX toxin-like protein